MRQEEEREVGVEPSGAKDMKRRTGDKWKTEEEKRCKERKNTIGKKKEKR